MQTFYHLTMSTNSHGMPSRVRAIAEIGRLLGDPHVPEPDRQAALNLLVQDHADLDDVEAHAALWAMGEMVPHAAAVDALLDCGPQLMRSSDGAQLFLQIYQRALGPNIVPHARASFTRIDRLALDDPDLASLLGLFR